MHFRAMQHVPNQAFQGRHVHGIRDFKLNLRSTTSMQPTPQTLRLLLINVDKFLFVCSVPQACRETQMHPMQTFMHLHAQSLLFAWLFAPRRLHMAQKNMVHLQGCIESFPTLNLERGKNHGFLRSTMRRPRSRPRAPRARSTPERGGTLERIRARREPRLGGIGASLVD